MDHHDAFVRLDVHKETISVAVAEAGRAGEVRHLGVLPNRPEVIAKLARKLVGRYGRIELAYDAGPCGAAIRKQPDTFYEVENSLSKLASEMVPRDHNFQKVPDLTGRGKPSRVC